MTDDGVKVEHMGTGAAEKRSGGKRSLETSGLGYGKKKKQHIDAFYSAMWPVLEGAGWSQVKGKGKNEGVTYFLPPGVTMGKKGESQEEDSSQSPSKDNPTPKVEGSWICESCSRNNMKASSRCGQCMAWRGGRRRRYLKKVRDVIERILQKKNDVDARAADAFVELVPNAYSMFSEQKDKKGGPSPDKKCGSSNGKKSKSPSKEKSLDISSAWKDERTHFEKASSRVGPEFQVDLLPAAGSYTSKESASCDGNALFEQVWDPKEAEKSGKLDFVDTRVKFNRRENAYNMLHARGYCLPGFYQEICKSNPSDGSDWTKNDKDNFRSAVFEHHENMREVSKMIGKPIDQCITYYLVKFKRTKSYKSLKRSMKRKANVSEGSAGILVCNECGKGGMLIACDTCEAHYHLACAKVESIPDGTWNCGNCKRETRSMLSVQDEMSTGTDTNPAQESAGDLSKGSVKEGQGGSEGEKSNFAKRRKINESEHLTPEKTNEGSNRKKIRTEETEMSPVETAPLTKDDTSQDIGGESNNGTDDDESKGKERADGICWPTNLDVLSGRGGGTNRHAGNIRFRDEARRFRESYQDKKATNDDKFLFSQRLVQRVLDYGGRFLEKGGEGIWYEMDEEGMRKKASQALRENKWDQGKRITAEDVGMDGDEIKRDCDTSEKNIYPSSEEAGPSLVGAGSIIGEKVDAESEIL